MVDFGQHHDALNLFEGGVQKGLQVSAIPAHSSVDDYRNGNLCCDFSFVWKSSKGCVVKYCVAVAYALTERNAKWLSHFREIECPIEPLISLNGDPGGRAYWREHLVFVDDVESVDVEKNVIPSLVWFQACDEIPEALRAFPQLVLHGTGETDSVFDYREPDALTGSIGPDGSSYRKVVEGTAHVVEGIASDSAGLDGDGVVCFEDETFWSSLRIVFRNGFPRLLFEPSIEKSIQVLYVMPRSVHLSADAKQMGVIGIEA